MGLFKIYNGPAPTTAGQAAVATGTSIITLLQIKPFLPCTIVEWGISFNGSVAATPILCELLATGTVFATVTAHVDADINHEFHGAGNAVASIGGLTLGTTATGYTASGEGSITETQMFDAQFIAPTNQNILQWPLGREAVVQIGDAGRIRVTAPASVDCICYMILEF